MAGATSAQADSWSAAASMAAPRFEQTATRLADGKVLVVGGVQAPGGPTPNAELYDPVADTWSPAGSMSIGRYGHTATLLRNGKVLVAGGNDGAHQVASAELYDPIANSWSSTPDMSTLREGHAATLLPSGKVLVTAGWTYSSPTTTTELYDPTSNTWTLAASMHVDREWHSATGLADGRVLVVGGRSGLFNQQMVRSAELYDPASDTWSMAASMPGFRDMHVATLLASGKVLLTGGATDPTFATGSFSTTADVYDPASDTWSTGGTLSVARMGHTATRLDDGRVLVTGGGGVFPPTERAELYDPASNAWTPAASMAFPRNIHAATLLADGRVLATGGNNQSGLEASAELYCPSAGTCAAPGVATISTTATANAPLGAQIADTATIAGLVGPAAGGTVDFRLYGPGDSTCSQAPVYQSPHRPLAPMGAGAVAVAAPYAPALPGTYRWRAFYSGDQHNAPIDAPCNDHNESVEVTVAEPAGLDHFKCYTVQRTPIATRSVTLRDEFATKNVHVHEARQLCNPVRKTYRGAVTPVANPTAHLVCRRTTDSPSGMAARTVRLRNQFEMVDTETTGARTLCVPSLKRIVKRPAIAPTGSDPERVLDHFRCYGVQRRPRSVGVKLLDQFGSSNTKVIALVRICNPVRKTFHGHVSPIGRPQAHLACYAISDGGSSFAGRNVIVRNQFGLASLRATAVESLCLPTFVSVLAVGPVRRPAR